MGIDTTVISYQRLEDISFLALMRAHDNLLRRSCGGIEG
jgi:hypothetical protein